MILHHFVICRNFNSRLYSYPNSPNLPNIRVNDDVAFFWTKINYLASLHCKNIYDVNSLEDGYGLFMCYVVLYTCFIQVQNILYIVLKYLLLKEVVLESN